MTVRQFDELHKLEYKPVVDRLVETIEKTLPDLIDDCDISCIVDFNEKFDNLIRQYADKYGRKNKKSKFFSKNT